MRILLLASLIALCSTIPSFGALIITEVHSYGSSNGTYERDWFELTNSGSTAVIISGFKMDDNSNSFGASHPLVGVTQINPGQSVVFIEVDEDEFSDTQTKFLDAWFGANIPVGFTMGRYNGSGVGLSGSGDAVNIFNSTGGSIASVQFGATAGNTNRTFDNGLGINGLLTGFSTEGVNGAFVSFDGAEIGSPGLSAFSAVPEPSSMAFLCLATGAGVLVRRMRKK